MKFTLFTLLIGLTVAFASDEALVEDQERELRGYAQSSYNYGYYGGKGGKGYAPSYPQQQPVYQTSVQYYGGKGGSKGGKGYTPSYPQHQPVYQTSVQYYGGKGGSKGGKGYAPSYPQHQPVYQAKPSYPVYAPVGGKGGKSSSYYGGVTYQPPHQQNCYEVCAGGKSGSKGGNDGAYYGGKGGKGYYGCETICEPSCHDVWVGGGKGGKGYGKGGKGAYYNNYGPSYRNLEGEEETEMTVEDEDRQLGGYPVYQGTSYGYYGKGKGKGGKGAKGGHYETICEPSYAPAVGGKGGKGGFYYGGDVGGYYGGKGGKGYYAPAPIYHAPAPIHHKCDPSPYCYGSNCCAPDPCGGGLGGKGSKGCGYYGGKGGKAGYYVGAQ